MALHKEGDVASGTLAAAPTTADVVILGGGIAGLATAAFLRQRTTLDVIVVDRGDVLASKRDEKDEVDEAEQHGLDGPVAADTSDSDYGIALAPNGTAILSLLGMNDPVTALQGSELNKASVLCFCPNFPLYGVMTPTNSSNRCWYAAKPIQTSQGRLNFQPGYCLALRASSVVGQHF